MTTTDPGTFVWYELLTTEPAATIDFYERVFGWTPQRLGSDDAYVMYASTQGPLASATTLPEPARKAGAPPFWTANVQVANVDEICELVRALAGRVLHEPTDYAGAGRIAVIADPFGAILNVFAPEKPRKQRDLFLPGEVCWHELLSDDPVQSLAFYGKVFGWTQTGVHDMGPMGKYVLFGSAGREVGGMFAKPKDVPISAWVFYFQVQNVDNAIARATELGGRLCNGPMLVPGGARVAQLVDPQGAAFAIHENPPRSAKG